MQFEREALTFALHTNTTPTLLAPAAARKSSVNFMRWRQTNER